MYRIFPGNHFRDFAGRNCAGEKSPQKFGFRAVSWRFEMFLSVRHTRVRQETDPQKYFLQAPGTEILVVGYQVS